MTFVWLLLSVLAFGVGEYLSKAWSIKPSLTLAMILVFPYMVGTWLWLPALQCGGSLAKVGIAWSIMSALVTVGLGLFCFHEVLSWYNYVGIGLAVAALVLLQV